MRVSLSIASIVAVELTDWVRENDFGSSSEA
jgi:hypothetical protein